MSGKIVTATGSFGQTVAAVATVLLAALCIHQWHPVLPLFPPGKEQPLPLLWCDDSGNYLSMSQGQTRQVPAPFTKRFLYPWLAREASSLTGQPLPRAFFCLSLLSLLLLAFCLAEILRASVGRPLLALLFLLTPYPLEGFMLGYLPDLFNTALIALFFLLLLREKWGWSLLALLVAFMARESTLLVCLFAAGLAWRQRRKRYAVGVGGVLIAGSEAGSFMARLGLPNPHHLPDFLYMLGKLPYYFLLAFFGVRIWSDTRPVDGTPFVTWPLPSWLRFGGDKIIGLARPDWSYPESTILCWLTTFGIGPLVLYWLWRRKPRLREMPFAIELALLYGTVAFLLAPLLGDWVDRLVGFGWPVFWIAVPWLLRSAGSGLERWRLAALGICFAAASWWPRFFNYGHARSANPWPSFGVIIFYIVAWWILHKQPRNTNANVSPAMP